MGCMAMGVAQVEDWTLAGGPFHSKTVVNHFILLRILHPAQTTTRLRQVQAHSCAMSNSTKSSFKLARQRIDTLPKSVVLDELRAAAEHFGGRRFSRREFD